MPQLDHFFFAEKVCLDVTDSIPVRCLNNGSDIAVLGNGCLEPRQPGGCKLKTAPVRPVVAARPAEYVCSEDLFY